MTIKEKIQQQAQYNDNSFDRALIRAGVIIIAGYLIGTVIGWLIAR